MKKCQNFQRTREENLIIGLKIGCCIGTGGKLCSEFKRRENFHVAFCSSESSSSFPLICSKE